MLSPPNRCPFCGRSIRLQDGLFAMHATRPGVGSPRCRGSDRPPDDNLVWLDVLIRAHRNGQWRDELVPAEPGPPWHPAHRA